MFVFGTKTRIVDPSNALPGRSHAIPTADTHHVLGQHTEARHAWAQARSLYQAQHRSKHARRVVNQINALEKAST